MEVLSKQACFVHQHQGISSAALYGSVSCSPSCCGIIRGEVLPSRWASSSKLRLLLPRISEGVLSRTLGAEYRTEWKWIYSYQEKRTAGPRVEASATIISAGQKNIASARKCRRRGTTRKPEGSGGFNVNLELEILTFMLQSGKADAFPSKEELLSAGRHDLVEAIVAEGGWLASGWEKKANGSVVGGGIQEVSRQRALRNKSKAVRAPGRRRGRPKLGERRSSITSAATENLEPDEHQKDAMTGHTDDQKLDAPSDGNDTIENQATKFENREKDRATSSSFKHVRKETGCKFPSSVVEYKLWEFESLAAFIDYRKLNANIGSIQRQQMGICSNSSVRKKRLDPEAAQRRHELCERRCKVASKLPSKGSKGDKVGIIKEELGSASTVEQNNRVDNVVTVKVELGTGLTIRQDTKVDEVVNPHADLKTEISIEQDTGVDDAVNPEAELATPTTTMQGRGFDEAVISQTLVNTATTIEQVTRIDEAPSPELELETGLTIEQLIRIDEAPSPKPEFETGLTIEQVTRIDEAPSPEPELETAPAIDQDTRFNKGIYPQAELNSAPVNESWDSNDGHNLQDTQVSITEPETDLPSSADRDTGIEEASSSYEYLERESTCQQEVRESVVEADGKLKKKKKRKKLKMEKSEETSKTPEKLSEALDWINQMVDQREKWMLEGNSRVEAPPDMPKSIQDRIRSLEERLSATRTALQSGREAVGQKQGVQEQPLSSPSDVHMRRLAELRIASDELEFMENKILKLSSELTTTRREVAALEGSRGIEITDFRNAAGENEKRIEQAKTNFQSLPAARIVWPHPAQEVFLIGSFDDWNQKIKMELSGAGVFVISLSLPPGPYEIKFIVDGTWRVDTERPIVYVGGYENNVLIIPEQFTFDWRK